MIATTSYVYQFPDVQSQILEVIDAKVLADIGLEAKSGGELFAYLFQPIAALLVCVSQFRIFYNRPDYVPLFGMCWRWLSRSASFHLPSK